jgi:hypothetical protein
MQLVILFQGLLLAGARTVHSYSRGKAHTKKNRRPSVAFPLKKQMTSNIYRDTKEI